MKKRILSIISATVFIVNTCLLSTGVKASTDIESNGDTNIRVATYNIGVGNRSDNGLERIKGQINEYDVDIIGIQEVDKFTNRTGKVDQLEFLKSEKISNGNFGKAINHDGGEYGLGFLTKHEIISYSDAKLDSQNQEQRIYQRSLINIDGKDVAFYNTHLSYESLSIRSKQLETIKNVMDNDTSEYKILTGDFNVDNTDEYSIFSDNYNIINGNNGVWYPTYSEEDCITPSLDNIIISKNIEINNIEMIGNKLSDHNMLYTDIILKEQKEENKNLALNKQVEVSGVEVADGRFTGPMAVDGLVSKESRWSAAKKDEQWLIVDLGEEVGLNQIKIRFHAEVPKYKVLVSLDGLKYDEVLDLTDGSQGNEVTKSITMDTRKVRYIKYLQLSQWKHTNGKYYGSSIYELEAYRESVLNVEEIANQIKSIPPTISEDGKTIILPQSPSDNYEVTLYGCDNKQVISMDGAITQPLEDMKVNLLYTVTNKENPEQVAHTDKDVSIIVPGKYEVEESDNKRPNVVPGLREWKGTSGEFNLIDTSKIVIETEELRETAGTIQFYLQEMLNKNLDILVGEPTLGDIYLTLDSEKAILGSEGYELIIDDYIKIVSSEEKGVLYGGISITQALYTDENHDSILKGEARDYPKYEVRSGMIDVGRMYIPLEYLEEMTVYMAWFKLNEIQVHVNDYWGASNYSAFRLESETYPMIMAEDGYYTKNDYKQYQKDVKKFGIDVITEIDTPYHAESFRNVPGAVMLKPGYLDIREESTYEIIENVLDEYLDGEEPVIQSDKFHIGTDEYDKKYSEEMRKYTDHFINYINNKGYETRLWGSLGTKGFNGTTPVSNKATMNLWAPYWADVKEMYNAGYDMINTCGGWLYIVPGSNAGYPDRLNIKKLYDEFEVNNYSPNRQPGNGTAIMPIAHPQTKGAEFALWNDVTTFRGGFSEFDVFDRFKDAVMITAEKTWYGEKTEGQTADEFENRVNTVENKVPGANPSRFVESKGDLVANYNFEEVNNNIVKDLSDNKYGSTLANGSIVEKVNGNAMRLQGDGYLSLPMDSIGYPYTVQMDVKLDENTPENTEIFSGKDGVLYLNIDGTGKLGFERSGYKFNYDYTMPKEKWVNITLTCNEKDTTLYINGQKISVASNMEVSKRKDSNTFILPLEKIGNNLKGEFDNISLYNRVLSDEEIIDSLDLAKIDNISLKKEATASSVHPKLPTLTADKAVDGVVSKDSRWASKRATGTGSNEDSGEYGTVEQWMEVDLGDVYKIDRIKINWEAAFATKYTILGSVDGNEYFEFKDIANGKVGISEFDDLGDKEARYMKILCKDASNRTWGYSIYEIEIYESTNNELIRTINKASETLSSYTKGNNNGNIPVDIYESYEEMLNDYKKLADGDKLSIDNMLLYKTEVINELKNIEKLVIIDNTELKETIEEAEKLNKEDFSEEVWNSFKITLDEAKNIYINELSTWQDISNITLKLKESIDNIEQGRIIVSKISNLDAKSTTDTVKLTWNEPVIKVGLVEYIIYVDGKEYTRVLAGNTEYTVDELSRNTIYGFKVVARYSNDKVSKPVSENIRTKK